MHSSPPKPCLRPMSLPVSPTNQPPLRVVGAAVPVPRRHATRSPTRGPSSSPRVRLHAGGEGGDAGGANVRRYTTRSRATRGRERGGRHRRGMQAQTLGGGGAGQQRLERRGGEARRRPTRAAARRTTRRGSGGGDGEGPAAKRPRKRKNKEGSEKAAKRVKVCRRRSGSA